MESVSYSPTPEEVLERRGMFVEALRSGRYVQGKNALRANDGGFCCLGVACDVYMKATGNGNWNECSQKPSNDVSVSFRYGDGFFESVSLPGPVKQWFGFVNVSGYSSDNERCLMEMNDSMGYTFPMIADQVEAGGFFEGGL